MGYYTTIDFESLWCLGLLSAINELLKGFKTLAGSFKLSNIEFLIFFLYSWSDWQSILLITFFMSIF
jgi:hypothetical protein